MRLRFPFIILIIVGLSGCASIIGDAMQSVSIDTPNCPGAKCRLVNSQGTYFVQSTPGTITINKAYSDLTITCEKGEKTSVSTHVSKSNMANFGNIIFGGIPGLLIDGGSGKGYDYSTYMINHLTCSK